jgi:hypothetical protein
MGRMQKVDLAPPQNPWKLDLLLNGVVLDWRADLLNTAAGRGNNIFGPRRQDQEIFVALILSP